MRNSLGAGVILAVLATGAAQGQSLHLAEPALDNIPQVCINGKLDNGKFLNWYYYNNPPVAKAFDSPAAVLQSFQKPGNTTSAQTRILDRITLGFLDMTGMSKSGFIANHSGKDLEPNDFLAGRPGNLVVSCVQPGAKTQTAAVSAVPVAAASGAAGGAAGAVSPVAQPAGTAGKDSAPPVPWYTNFRVRGVADDLTIDRGAKAFSGASAATISFSANGPTKNTNNALQTAIGYDFKMGPNSYGTVLDIIPFAAVDRSITAVSGKQSASSREDVSTGVIGSLTVPFPGKLPGASVLSVTAEHIWDDIAGTQLNYLHFVDLPVWVGARGAYLDTFLNAYRFYPCCDTETDETWFAFSPVFDVRGDLGFYSDRGPMSAKYPDYSQIGTQFGFDLSMQRISSDLKVTETWMRQFNTSRKDISLFEVAWTLNLFNKDVGLKASYQIGNLEATAQRIEQWLVGLSVKY